jgi:diamine N-acetyltransferase
MFLGANTFSPTMGQPSTMSIKEKVYLEPVTSSNWKACIALELAPEQAGLLPSNLYSIAEAQFYEQSKSKVIYNEAHHVVGYALFGRDIFTNKWKIFRIMIDQSHQRQGYGESAMKEIIGEISRAKDGEEVLICYHDRNDVARRLYTKLGFVEQEIDPDGRVTARLKLNQA